MTVLVDGAENTPAAWTLRAQRDVPAHEAVGWSRRSQGARFDAIFAALHPRHNESLLDYGCGTGALSRHLRIHVDYLGFDWSLGMTERASREHPCEKFATTLDDGDTWDLVVCCGTFNLADNWSKAQTWALIRMLFARSRRAMAVSLYCGDDPRCIRYVPSEVATTANALTHDFTIERGYLPNDLLMVLRQGPVTPGSMEVGPCGTVQTSSTQSDSGAQGRHGETDAVA